MNVLALDLSLTATGLAHCDGSTDTWKVDATGPERLRILRDRLISLLDAAVDLVVIEGYSMGGQRGSAGVGQALGEWGGVCRLALHEAGQLWCEIPPSNLKKYATGKGNASKDEVYGEAIRRLGYAGKSKDEADALWLRAMALDHYSYPVTAMPAVNRDALTKIAWPELAVAA